MMRLLLIQGYGAEYPSQTIIIGNSTATLSTSNPTIIGEFCGVRNGINCGKFYFYNGILKGKSEPYKGAITGTRSGKTLTTGTSGEYKTAYFR